MHIFKEISGSIAPRARWTNASPCGIIGKNEGGGGVKKLSGAIKGLLGRQAVRYFLSSCAAFAVDYAITLILSAALGGLVPMAMELAATVAFACSSQVNFHINRAWVFRSHKKIWPELVGYYSLALVSFSVKTFVLLEALVRLVGLPLALAKPLAEAVMFVFNFFVQKLLIFRRRDKNK